jgi:hypothetical protein
MACRMIAPQYLVVLAMGRDSTILGDCGLQRNTIRRLVHSTECHMRSLSVTACRTRSRVLIVDHLGCVRV